MEIFRPHHLQPDIDSVRVALVCRDFTGGSLSHVGLRISADYTAKTLQQHGIWAEAWSLKSAEDLVKKLRKAHESAVNDCEVRPSHVVISAPWIPSAEVAAMAYEFPNIMFAVTSHSSVGFLSADPSAIKIMREIADLQMMCHNVFVAGNSQKFVSWATDTWGVHATWLPNLYCTSENFNHHRKWNGGLLRLGIFGANRPLKNAISGAAAAAELATKLGTPIELYLSSGRNEGGSFKAIDEITSGIPNLKIIHTGWLSWPAFRRLLRTIDLVFQVSYTESFNVVTADAISEGVPVVVSEAIDWVPKDWKAIADEPSNITHVAERLLHDPNAVSHGRKALEVYVHTGVQGWKNWLLPHVKNHTRGIL
jgi:hypothetical protein